MTHQIETTVKSGLPCLAKITHYFKQPAQGSSADSDWDCYGYEDIEFELLTLKGKPAPWLNNLVSKKDRARIESEISTYMNGNN